MKFDIKTTKLNGCDYAVQMALSNDLTNDIRNRVAKELAESYDEFVFSLLGPFGITKENYRDHIDRVAIIGSDLVKHFYVDHNYRFSIFIENDLSGFDEEHGYKITTKYRVDIVEHMIR